VKPVDGSAKALTAGKFEVSHPQLSTDGKSFYVRTNQTAPYSYDVYRVSSNGGALTRVTQYGGMEQFVLSPDDSQLAVLHSSAYVLPQLAVQSAQGSAPRELTNTMKPEFTAHAWTAPKIVEVPSSHGAGVIYGKYYGPANETNASASRPAVIFVHGAGYLQDVSVVHVLPARTDVQQPARATRLCRDRCRLSRIRRLRPRLAHRDLPQDGSSGTGRLARWQGMAGEEPRRGSQARGYLRRQLRRLHDRNGIATRTG
jgi:hypothetical protein